MKSRKFQIAFSTTCIIACLLLLALWARSNRTVDFLQWNKTRYGWGVAVTLFHGRCEFMFASYNEVWTSMKAGFTFKTARNTKWSWPTSTFLGFSISSTDTGNHFLSLPHWFLILIAGFLAATPWIPRRFSLRILLTATTLIAAMLGLAACLGRL